MRGGGILPLYPLSCTPPCLPSSSISCYWSRAQCGFDHALLLIVACLTMDCFATMQPTKVGDLWIRLSRPSQMECLRAGKELACCIRSDLQSKLRSHDHASCDTIRIGNRRASDFPFLLGTEIGSLVLPLDRSCLPFAPLSASGVQMYELIELGSDFSCGLLDRGQITCNFATLLQSDSPKVEKQECAQVDDYYVNAGYAIRNLRDELPVLFYKEMNYSIYRDDIVFCDPRNTFGGLRQYKRIFGSLRFYGRILFKALWMDVIRIWQPSERVIMVRWAVHGIARIPWEARGQFDGISEYKLDKQGKIYEHRVHNVVLSKPTKSVALASTELAKMIGCHAHPTPSLSYKFCCLPWTWSIL